MIDLAHINELSETTPVLVNLKPVGEHYMEDLFAAGGVDAVLRELAPLLDLSAMTVSGETLGELLARPPDRPHVPSSAPSPIRSSPKAA